MSHDEHFLRFGYTAVLALALVTIAGFASLIAGGPGELRVPTGSALASAENLVGSAMATGYDRAVFVLDGRHWEARYDALSGALHVRSPDGTGTRAVLTDGTGTIPVAGRTIPVRIVGSEITFAFPDGSVSAPLQRIHTE